MPYPQPCKYQAEHPPTDLVLNTSLFSQGHSVSTTLKDQKPQHVRSLYFFLSAMSSPSKSAKSLEEAPVPLQPSILWCVVWEKLLSGKVSQKISFWAPSSSVLRYGYVPGILNIPLAKLWQAGACGTSNDLCLLPFTSWHVLSSHSSPDIPHQAPCAVNSSAELRAADSSLSPHPWGCAVGAALHGRDSPSLQTLWWPDHSKTDRRDTRDKHIYLLSLASGENVYDSKVVFFFIIWVWDRRQTPCPRFYWLKRTSRQWKAKL